MEFLRFLAVDVGPYFGVFIVLVSVIYWQMRMIISMLEITRTLDGNHHDDSDDHQTTSVHSPPSGESGERGQG